MPHIGSSPCYKCPNVTIGCHSTCRDYLQWKANRDELREADYKCRNSIQPSSFLTLGDANLSYTHFNINHTNDKRDRQRKPF